MLPLVRYYREAAKGPGKPPPPAEGIDQLDDLFRRFLEERRHPDPQKTYRPVHEADVFLTECLQADAVKAPHHLLRLVNKWGHFGIGDAEILPFLPKFDSVARTRWALVDVQHLANEVKEQLDISTERRRPRDWQIFALNLNQRLAGRGIGPGFEGRGVHPALVPARTGPQPVWQPTRLLDVPYLQLWFWATERRSLRRCKGCGALFSLQRKNQTYCSENCGKSTWIRARRAQTKEARTT